MAALSGSPVVVSPSVGSCMQMTTSASLLCVPLRQRAHARQGLGRGFQRVKIPLCLAGMKQFGCSSYRHEMRLRRHSGMEMPLFPAGIRSSHNKLVFVQALAAGCTGYHCFREWYESSKNRQGVLDDSHMTRPAPFP